MVSSAADDHAGARLAAWPSSGGHVGPVFGPSNADKTRPVQPPRRVPLPSIILPSRIPVALPLSGITKAGGKACLRLRQRY